MRGLKAAGITLDRKMLADMAVDAASRVCQGGGAGQGRAPRRVASARCLIPVLSSDDSASRIVELRCAALDFDALRALGRRADVRRRRSRRSHDEFLSRKSGIGHRR